MPAKAKVAGVARSYLKPVRNRYSLVFVQSVSKTCRSGGPNQSGHR